MIGLIPAAGKGTRLQPWTRAIPKELLIVGDHPIIEHTILQMKAAGVNKIFIIISDGKDLLKKYLGDGSKWGLEISYLIQEVQNGLAKAIHLGAPHIKEDFVVLLGDNLILPHESLKSAVAFHNKTNARVTLGVYPVSDPQRFGVAEINEHGTVTSLEEKPAQPKSNLAVMGMYVFSPEIFSYIEKTEPGAKNEYQITDSIRLMMQDSKKVVAQKHTGEWFDIGTKESYIMTNKLMYEK